MLYIPGGTRVFSIVSRNCAIYLHPGVFPCWRHEIRLDLWWISFHSRSKRSWENRPCDLKQEDFHRLFWKRRSKLISKRLSRHFHMGFLWKIFWNIRLNFLPIPRFVGSLHSLRQTVNYTNSLKRTAGKPPLKVGPPSNTPTYITSSTPPMIKIHLASLKFKSQIPKSDAKWLWSQPAHPLSENICLKHPKGLKNTPVFDTFSTCPTSNKQQPDFLGEVGFDPQVTTRYRARKQLRASRIDPQSCPCSFGCGGRGRTSN